jgi:hypothetical protein
MRTDAVGIAFVEDVILNLDATRPTLSGELSEVNWYISDDEVRPQSQRSLSHLFVFGFLEGHAPALQALSLDRPLPILMTKDYQWSTTNFQAENDVVQCFLFGPPGA